MKKICKIAVLLLLVFFAVSCRPQPDLSRDFGEPETWGETFEIFWKKMSTNYVFWNLDYDEGRGWDSVYDEYRGKFDSLGLVNDTDRSDSEQKENSLKAYRYFFDITKDLSDGHYLLQMDDQRNNAFQISPSTYRSLKEYGFTDDELFRFFSDTEYRQDPKFSSWRECFYENTVAIMNNTFCLPSEVIGSSVPSGPLATKYKFGTMQYVYKVVDTGASETPFHIVLGKTEDGIVYFSFNTFMFYDFFAEAAIKGEDNAVTSIVEEFYNMASSADTKGIIIDLRGNTGGNIADMSILWTALLPDDVDSLTIGYTRRKASENRTDYNAWTPFIVSRSELFDVGTFNEDIPLAVILNDSSVSCAEMSTCAFMALRDGYGYNVRLFGSSSCGGMGSLNEESEERYNGGITAVMPFISLLYTPFCQMKYLDGNRYEGKGLPVDEYIKYNSEAFNSGMDPRLSAALEWISSN